MIFAYLKINISLYILDSYVSTFNKDFRKSGDISPAEPKIVPKYPKQAGYKEWNAAFPTEIMHYYYYYFFFLIE
jgi:hypothetical protein